MAGAAGSWQETLDESGPDGPCGIKIKNAQTDAEAKLLEKQRQVAEDVVRSIDAARSAVDATAAQARADADQNDDDRASNDKAAAIVK